MIKIVDYGLGNIQAFLNIYKSLNIPAMPAKKCNDLKEATHLILPGVGSFDQAMLLLENSGMRSMLDDLVLNKKLPILGVCVGMQMLGNNSEEGNLSGLGWISGGVKKIKFNDSGKMQPLPHMGWNDISIIDNNLFFDLGDSPLFYFLHSYYFQCVDNSCEIASVSYGSHMSCAINKDNIYGVQFHPEKSHHYGIKLLKNFSNI